MKTTMALNNGSKRDVVLERSRRIAKAKLRRKITPEKRSKDRWKILMVAGILILFQVIAIMHYYDVI